LSIEPRPAHPAVTILARYWLPVVLWMALILFLSGRSDLGRQPNPVTGEPIRTTFTIAKGLHLLEYGVLAALLFRATTAPGGGVGLRPGRAAVWAVLIATGFGAADELRQSFVPAREPRLADVAIDGLGAILAAAALTAWARGRPRHGAARPVAAGTETG
jgi:VanZ family protein